MDKGKIIIDPVYGFIHVGGELPSLILRHPLFHRLTRIKQLGLNSEVYPGAQHTRFQHSLGAYHLMGQALNTLSQKGVPLSSREREAALAAILLHDVGHGPFSHVLEHTLFGNISHEDISLLIMKKLNREWGGKLENAIAIFQDTYPRHFLHELICSQLDVDRLDYLHRDSFFTGVREGSIGVERIIGMLHVADDRLVVESKGIYSLENYLLSRRLMYWQVYLHKTAIAAEVVLTQALRRAAHLIAGGTEVEAPKALHFFLEQSTERERFLHDETCLEHYAELDDTDVWSALKEWRHHHDKVLRLLSRSFSDRALFKVEMLNGKDKRDWMERKRKEISSALQLSEEEVGYCLELRELKRETYSRESQDILLLYPDGSAKPLPQVSELIHEEGALGPKEKTYACYLKTPLQNTE